MGRYDAVESCGVRLESTVLSVGRVLCEGEFGMFDEGLVCKYRSTAQLSSLLHWCSANDEGSTISLARIGFRTASYCAIAKSNSSAAPARHLYETPISCHVSCCRQGVIRCHCAGQEFLYRWSEKKNLTLFGRPLTTCLTSGRGVLQTDVIAVPLGAKLPHRSTEVKAANDAAAKNPHVRFARVCRAKYRTD